jgi:hypothetical protein
MSAKKAGFYKTKPCQIEAFLYDGFNGETIRGWSNGKVIDSPVAEPTSDNPTGRYVQVYTLEGVMIGIVGDYIIKGIRGEFYPCKPDVFNKKYELIGS